MEQAVNREPIHSDTETALTPAVDLRAYRAGVIAGVLSFIAFLGVVKDLNALLDPGGRGEWLFLLISFPLELSAAWLLWRYRNLFVR